MTNTKIYPLRIHAFMKVMFVGVLGVMTLAGLAIPFSEAAVGSPPPVIFAIFWFGILGIGWYQVLSLSIGDWIDQGWFRGWWGINSHMFSPTFQSFVEDLIARRASAADDLLGAPS